MQNFFCGIFLEAGYFSMEKFLVDPAIRTTFEYDPRSFFYPKPWAFPLQLSENLMNYKIYFKTIPGSILRRNSPKTFPNPFSYRQTIFKFLLSPKPEEVFANKIISLEID